MKFRFGKNFLIVYFLLGIGVISFLWIYYTRRFLTIVSKDIEIKARIYARYLKTENVDQIIFEEIIEKLDFPVILTDDRGNILSYRNIEPSDTTETKLKYYIKYLDSKNKPIILKYKRGKDSIHSTWGTIHYGLSPSTQAVNRFSYIQIVFVVIFVGLGIWGLLTFKKREEEHIWTTLAKETAHQLGTPMSSLMGWIETFEFEEIKKREIIKQIKEDIKRMKYVVERFSRIGSPLREEPVDIEELIKEMIDFIKRRTARNITFELELKKVPRIKGDKILLSWTIENLLKNSIDALTPSGGTIKVRGELIDRSVIVDIIDNGKGIIKKDIFKAGKTTKKHGWGLGLTLAKRIIEDYHKGELILIESKPGKTVFRIILSKIITK